jgi:hypothetical protein
MIEIFIPVLFVCFSNGCEILQSNKSYKTVQECNQAVIEQKQELIEYVKTRKNLKMKSLESVCVGPKTDDSAVCGPSAQHICRN